MKVAIVILNWNGKQLLEQFLPSIVNHSSEEASVFVADNASTDNSLDFVRNNYPSVNIIKNKENGGYAKGYNDALQHIKADIYCLINSDVEVTKNWLTPIIETFKSDATIAAIQPKLLDFRDKGSFEYAGAAGGFLDYFGYPYCRGRVFNTLEKDENQFEEKTDIFWASGACFFVRSAVFHQLNGFDEDYFAHQEEVDLCWRIQNIGHTIVYQPKSEVYHVGGATLSNINPKKTFLNFRNSLLNIVKNIPKGKLVTVILARLILDGVAGVKFLLELKPMHSLAILKAHFSFYKYLPSFLRKRKMLTQQVNYHKHFSVVWQYFVLNRRKFKDLK